MAAQRTTQRRTVAARGDGSRLREEILDAAIALVEEVDDPWKLSLRAVARRVGVAATSIYLHFDSLDELLMAVKLALWQRFGDVMVAAAEAGGTPYERVVRFGQAYVEFARDNPGAFQQLFTMTWKLPLPAGESFIGAAQFELLVDTLAEVSATHQEAQLRATQLWCGVHGMVVLRSPMSHYPWLEIEEQLASLARVWTTPGLPIERQR
ncbi:TetR/AcrR family transcriptional regulator [Flexivirga caeni]|uniref:TetR/AcrR family transcriptional regulator n=1 Tax=Flexivirga caeni TaxID=2294115 RepID=A0A3M9M1J1_9MICO|nr:TetR/AcrR family transcriptional regulator [Flexivirga caeni]RNI19015.1 TetR/AcrR family transcriptional regulator [Flexivirga caeni]